jgi:hypothetical protein
MVGLYYEEWLLPGQQPAYLCQLCNSKKTFRSIKNHEQWFKHQERDLACREQLRVEGQIGEGRDTSLGAHAVG